jgi:hypothetical protein
MVYESAKPGTLQNRSIQRLNVGAERSVPTAPHSLATSGVAYFLLEV